MLGSRLVDWIWGEGTLAGRDETGRVESSTNRGTGAPAKTKTAGIFTRKRKRTRNSAQSRFMYVSPGIVCMQIEADLMPRGLQWHSKQTARRGEATIQIPCKLPGQLFAAVRGPVTRPGTRGRRPWCRYPRLSASISRRRRQKVVPNCFCYPHRDSFLDVGFGCVFVGWSCSVVPTQEAPVGSLRTACHRAA